MQVLRDNPWVRLLALILVCAAVFVFACGNRAAISHPGPTQADARGIAAWVRVDEPGLHQHIFACDAGG